VQATAHGLSVYNTIVQSGENAEAVVEQAYEAMVEDGLDIYDQTVSDTVYAQSFDIAYKKLTYFEDKGTKVRIVVLYADLLQPHYYLSAQITYLPEQTDEASQTLAEELGDAYTLPAAVLDPMAEG
jgi:hypothetical protein